MAMQWLERELRRSSYPGDTNRADEINRMLQERGRDIPFTNNTELELEPPRNIEGYKQLARLILKVKVRAESDRFMRERITDAHSEDFERLADVLDNVMDVFTPREEYVLTQRVALRGQDSKPVDRSSLAARLSLPETRVEDIERDCVNRMRRSPHFPKLLEWLAYKPE